MTDLFLLLARLVNFYSFLVFIRVLLTWIPGLDPYNPIVRVLNQITEPILEPARRIVPPIGMIDISTIVVLVVLSILANILENMAYRM